MLWTKSANQCISFQTFETFECSNKSSLNSSCYFWNDKVRVYSNFASLFSIMKDDSPVYFRVKCYILCREGTNQNAHFGDFWVIGSKFTELLSFLKLVVWKMTWWIWKIFIRTLTSVKIGTFKGFFCSK